MTLSKKQILELESWIELEKLIFDHTDLCHCPEIESLECGYYYIIRTASDSWLNGRMYGVTFNASLELTAHRVYPEDFEDEYFHIGNSVTLGHRDKMRLMNTIINYIKSLGEKHERKYREHNARVNKENMIRIGRALTETALENSDILDIPGPNGNRIQIDLMALRSQGFQITQIQET